MDYKHSTHTVAEIDAATDGFQAHAANSGIHMTAAEKQKLSSLVNYDDTPLRTLLNAEAAARSAGDSDLETAITALSRSVAAVTELSVIPVLADLNRLVNAGCYTCRNANVAESLSHCPWTTSAFRMDVFPLSPDSLMQRILPADGTQAVVLTRVYLNETWQPWYRFSGEVITNA